MQDKLFEFISKYIALTEEEKNVIISLDIFRSVKKGTVLLKEGQKSKNSFFVLKGCIRKYYVLDGEEKTTAFYTEMEGLTPHCVISQTASQYFISCIEDTILVISNSDMEVEVNRKFPKFDIMCKILSEELLAKKQIDFDEFKTSSPEQRYLNLLEKRPDLIQRVPQHQLASYLGIKPQSLSRLRSRILEKKNSNGFLNLSERDIVSRRSTFALSIKHKKHMQKKILFIGILLMMIVREPVKAQYAISDSTYKRWFVGSSLFLLGNLANTNPPDFVQLNVGYRITGRDVIALEPKTWKYAWPNGIHPFLNKSYGKPEEEFPGYIREFGLSLAYQRFWWKGLYTELNLMPSIQKFASNEGKKFDNGFQIFNTYRVGYHIKLFNDKFFIQPSFAMTHRAYHTELPDGFKQLDDKWSKFVFPEPGFHFGFNF